MWGDDPRVEYPDAVNARYSNTERVESPDVEGAVCFRTEGVAGA